MNKDNAPRTGVLLVNLGSPEKPTSGAVRRYLREFLSDPRVVNIPRILWWFILNFLVLPFRPRKSAEAYKKIWTAQGSPLVVISQQLSDKLQAACGENISVKLAMRYGKPAISEAIQAFKEQQVQRLIILPLYPQYSITTTATVYDVVIENLSSWPYLPELHFINDYYRHASYISALKESIERYWSEQGQQKKLLLSFHGLPAKSIDWGDPYYFQCKETAKALCEQLQLSEDQWLLVFQSRFGRAEWLQPYCIETLENLPSEGVTEIDLVCPGFAVDCLETLEEIAMTNKSVFIEAGGREYRYIPCLNASDQHVKVLFEVIKKYL